MKASLSILLFVIISTVYVHGESRSAPFLSHKIKYDLLLRDGTTPEDKCKDQTKYCSDDCLGIVICKGGKPVGKTDCAKQTGNQKPYCNKNTLTCDSSPDNCDTSAVAEKCDFAGFQPDLLRCKQFYDCEKKGSDKIPYKCDGNTVYNPKAEECQFGTTCYDFSNNGLCKNKDGMVIVHPADKRFFVYCTNEVPVLDKCEGSVNKITDVYEYDPSTMTCEYVCKQSGRYKDLYAEKCETYYECTQNGSSFFKSKKKCLKDMKFDEEAKKCTTDGGKGCKDGGSGGGGSEGGGSEGGGSEGGSSRGSKPKEWKS